MNSSWNREREAQKQAEVLSSLKTALVDQGLNYAEAESLAGEIFSAYVTTSPPEKEPTVMQFMTIGNSGFNGGKSTKPGNITLNMGRLIEALASGGLAAAGVSATPYLAPLAAIVLWCSLWRTAQVSISETDAVVLYVMWMHKDGEYSVAHDGLVEKCNAHLDKYGRSPVTQQQVDCSLKNLQAMETIQKSKQDKSKWWLREWVRRTYR